VAGDTVTINLSAIGGSPETVMTLIAEDVYSVITNASVGTPAGVYKLRVNATDIYGNSNITEYVQLVVTAGMCGDVAPYPDCNGIVDMGDVILLLNNVSYPENPRYVLCNEWAGDCRCSGVRDMGDVILLLNNVSYPENPRYALDCC
jgi:hypothetical protein